jgi:hypothetical protein
MIFDPQTEARIREMLARLAPRVIRRAGGRRDLVRNAHGKPLPCCWSDCWTPGSTRHQVTVPHDSPSRPGAADTLTYIFCGPVHKSMWLGSSLRTDNYGNTHDGPASRSGLILP